MPERVLAKPTPLRCLRFLAKPFFTESRCDRPRKRSSDGGILTQKADVSPGRAGTFPLLLSSGRAGRNPMRPRHLSVFLWAVLALTLSPVSAAPAAEPVLIEKVTVISPEREAPLREAFVLIEEGRIRSVDTKRPAAAKGVRVIDGRGRF